MTPEERELKEAELRCLKSDMYYAHDIGDWKMARSLEQLIDKLSTVTSINEISQAFLELKQNLADDISKRKATRIRIEELEEELKEE